MDLVVNRLSEIEAASVRILEEAAVQNKELDDASKKAMQKFDANIDRETQKKLESLRASLDLEKKKKPIVYLDAKPYDFKGRYVKSNNYDCVYQVISECIKKGYEDFLMISDGEAAISVGFENTQGYKDALQDACRDGGPCISRTVSNQTRCMGC